MKVSRNSLAKIIKEEVIREMSYMKDAHIAVGDSILSIVDSSPGIDGMSLIAAVQADLQSDHGADEYLSTLDADSIFAVTDDLQEENYIWLDEEKDAWYLPGTPEYDAAIAQRG